LKSANSATLKKRLSVHFKDEKHNKKGFWKEAKQLVSSLVKQFKEVVSNDYSINGNDSYFQVSLWVEG
jgi:hypothetical protein